MTYVPLFLMLISQYRWFFLTIRTIRVYGSPIGDSNPPSFGPSHNGESAGSVQPRTTGYSHMPTVAGRVPSDRSPVFHAVALISSAGVALRLETFSYHAVPASPERMRDPAHRYRAKHIVGYPGSHRSPVPHRKASIHQQSTLLHQRFLAHRLCVF